MELGVDRVGRLGDQRVDDVVEVGLLVDPPMRPDARLDRRWRVIAGVLGTAGSLTRAGDVVAPRPDPGQRAAGDVHGLDALGGEELAGPQRCGHPVLQIT